MTSEIASSSETGITRESPSDFRTRADNRGALPRHVEPGTIMAVPITPGADLTLGRPAVVVKGPYASPRYAGRHYDVSPDGKRFLLLKDVETSGSTEPPPPEIRVVQHWVNELERLVPAK